MHEILRDKKFIFFDVGYTLEYPASGDWTYTNKFLETAGERFSAVDEAEKLRAAAKGFEFTEKHHLVFTVAEEIVCYRELYAFISDELRLGLTEKEIDAISRDRAYNMDNFIGYPGMTGVLEALSREYKLGIISDTWPSVTDQLEHIGAYEYFSTFTYSCSLGVFKPSPLMYRDALSKCGVDAKDTVFIDDHIPNLYGAAEQGITPVLITAKYDTEPEWDFCRIRSLEELTAD